jgi:Ca2+-binding EF-hand superfamily protein
VHRLLEQMDMNHDGTLSVAELSAGLRTLFPTVDACDVDSAIEALDTRGVGSVSCMRSLLTRRFRACHLPACR